MIMHASESNPRKVDELGNGFLEELFRHHFVCEGSGYNPFLGMTADEFWQANPLEMAGARFVAELLRRFQGETLA